MNAKSSAPTDERLTYARDVMTGTVASVRLDVPVPEIAKLLLEKRISAVPVVNDDGVPLGMVSEGDLVGRDERDRLARSDWWLAIVSGSQPLDDKFEARMQATDLYGARCHVRATGNCHRGDQGQRNCPPPCHPSHKARARHTGWQAGGHRQPCRPIAYRRIWTDDVFRAGERRARRLSGKSLRRLSPSGLGNRGG